ncbi:MAG: stage II sporulation protein D [Oscillospiraceae bacterium]|nr:stage II sporulation protein D [Oscillospiraceae bacterium]
MKKTVFLAYLALLLAFLPYLLRPIGPAAEETAEPVPTGQPIPAQETPPVPAGAPAAASVRVLVNGAVEEMDMQDYLTGVLAAEMPADFQPEALKAQAVAARTYALYCAAAGKHGDADVCTDFSCCQAWQDDAALREKWGADYDAHLQKLHRAVDETAGQYLSYEGQPVFAAFHSSSAGATEDCGQVWNPRPYLVCVPSPESAETVPGYVSELVCAPLDFRDVLLSACPEADFSGAPEDWLGGVQRDESGRVAELTLGGHPFRGTELRSLFSLRSTAFTLEYTDGHFVFTVTGSGHGVGMSQYGANVMAAQGADYREILAHYYPGTVLVQ